jgi:hypothetical protein
MMGVFPVYYALIMVALSRYTSAPKIAPWYANLASGARVLMSRTPPGLRNKVLMIKDKVKDKEQGVSTPG